jgi:carboxymethylenebutenolidase
MPYTLDAFTRDAHAALKANNKKYEVFEYKGAQHGFHNDTTPRYNEAAAKQAWQRTVDFFRQWLA